MAYEFTAHDRGLELLWRPGCAYTLLLCPAHGLYVVKEVDLFAKCWCGAIGEKHVPEKYRKT